MTANRVVAAATPLAAVVAGIASEWLARHFPGVNVPASALEEIFVGGMAAVLAPSIVWLLGWQKHEARQGTDAERFEARLQSHELALAEAGLPVAGPATGDEPPPAFEDFEPAELLVEDDDDAEPGLDQLAAVELAAIAELDDEAEADLDDAEQLVDEDELDDEDDDLLAELSIPTSPGAVV